MDVPDLFLAEDAPTMPQARRSRRPPTPPTGGAPPALRKDQSIVLPNTGVMARAIRLVRNRRDVVTSGSEGYSGDGVHAATSQHYKGTALDLRYTTDRAEQVFAYESAGYVVIPESDHLHIQAYRV